MHNIYPCNCFDQSVFVTLHEQVLNKFSWFKPRFLFQVQGQFKCRIRILSKVLSKSICNDFLKCNDETHDILHILKLQALFSYISGIRTDIKFSIIFVSKTGYPVSSQISRKIFVQISAIRHDIKFSYLLLPSTKAGYPVHPNAFVLQCFACLCTHFAIEE